MKKILFKTYHEVLFIILLVMHLNFCITMLKNRRFSTSQLYQDLFVIVKLKKFKQSSKYFVEFGAADGIRNSNTFLLETQFDFKGILAEPSRTWQHDLNRNRNCSIDFRCVFSESKEIIQFSEATNPELSTITHYKSTDSHAQARTTSVDYPVETITLNDLLVQHNAPYDIDYLSVDTEGSEFIILENFPFHKYKIKIITVEHNFTENRNKLHSLLQNHGYEQHHKLLSRFDSWYILKN